MPDDFDKRLSNAILETVAYADIFDHPLTAPEIHHYLSRLSVPFEILNYSLQNTRGLDQTRDYFTLPGRGEIIPLREQRRKRSQRLLPRAIQFGRILGSLPFIRMVALTGSLAVLNVSKADDFDYMLVAAPGRVWTARAFALSVNRITKRFGYTLCPNLIVSINCLEWPLHDLYSARELCQMIPIAGMEVYRDLIRANRWAWDFLPNAFAQMETALPARPERASALQMCFEFVLRGGLGERFETWERTRKIRRFSNQDGFGEETVFNADVCQGNFHHHRKWTHHAYQQRLKHLYAEPAGEGTR